MNDMSAPDRDPPPLHFGDPASGMYWTAERHPDQDEQPDDYTVTGDLKFDWDFGVTVPLWDDEGLLPDDPEWLRRALGLSDELIRDMDRWGRDRLRLDLGELPQDMPETMDSRALALVERLRQELAGRFTVTYSP